MAFNSLQFKNTNVDVVYMSDDGFVIIIASSWIALRFKDSRTVEYLNIIFVLALVFVYTMIFRYKYSFIGLNLNLIATVGITLAILIDIVFYYLIGKIKKEML